MFALTRWLATRFLKDQESFRHQAVRIRIGVLEGWVSLIINLVLACMKLVMGLMLQSAGLISDAVHSLGDMATSLVVILGFRFSRKPPDPEHPFGHEKSEHIASLIISVLLIIAGFELGKETLLELMGNPEAGGEIPLTWGMLAVLLVLVVVKELLARFSAGLGGIIDSPALHADGWHHRSDSITTALVIIALGGRNFGFPWMDGVAGVLVSLFIMYTGFHLAYQSISPLLGETAPSEEIERIKVIGGRVPGVVSVHDIRVQRYGHFNFTTLHIELSDRLDVHKMHEITVQLEVRILREFPGECVVHIDPIDIHHPLFNEVANALREVVIVHPELVDFHDLQLWNENGDQLGEVEVSVEPDAPDEAYEAISSHLQGEITRRFPGLQMSVRLKVDFSASPLQA